MPPFFLDLSQSDKIRFEFKRNAFHFSTSMVYRNTKFANDHKGSILFLSTFCPFYVDMFSILAPLLISIDGVQQTLFAGLHKAKHF